MSLTSVELARRLQALFAHVRPKGRVYDPAELLAVTSRVSGRPPVLSVALITQLRSGTLPVAPLPAQLDALAHAFGVPTGYLTGAIPGTRIEAQLRMLTAVRNGHRPGSSINSLRIADDDQAFQAPACVRLAWPWSPQESEGFVVGIARGRARSRLLRRCGDLAREIDQAIGVPSPFDLEEFIDRLAQHRGRPIELLPCTGDDLPAGVCGLWLVYSDRDVIGYPLAASRPHRDHIIMHEVGHITAGHAGSTSTAGPADGHSITESALLALMPDLDPEMVRAVLGRSVYSAEQEQEAETLASLIMQRSLVERRPRGWQGALAGQDEVAARVEGTFGFR